jgi:hypothetical protein
VGSNPIAHPMCDVSRHRGHREPASGARCFLWPAGWAAGGLVVPGRVEGEFAQEFAGVGVDDADVQVLDQEQDAGSGVGAADADVVEPAVVAQGDDPRWRLCGRCARAALARSRLGSLLEPVGRQLSEAAHEAVRFTTGPRAAVTLKALPADLTAMRDSDRPGVLNGARCGPSQPIRGGRPDAHLGSCSSPSCPICSDAQYSRKLVIR